MNRFLKNTALLPALTLSASAAWAASEPIVLVSPPDYQVISISPNGKWATGVYSDYSSSQRGFLWNLETNSFELLSTSEESNGWSVADDGTVCGAFTDHSTSDIGAGTVMPGYYRDGEWHGVEVPAGFSGPSDNYHGAGQGYAISANGKVMAGALYVNGNYSPAVWQEGVLLSLLDISNDGMQGGAPYCISPDGTLVGGWAYQYNRHCAFWNLNNNTRTFIGDTEGPWSTVNRFSPDGKKVLYGGGWDGSIDPEAQTQYYLAIYDVETGEITRLPAYSYESTVALFGISNSYTCVGSTGDYDNGRAVIYLNGQGPAILLEDYLTEQGVNLDELDIVNPEEIGYRLLFRGQDISADGNIIAALGYDNMGLHSYIVMLNQDSEHAAPTNVKARQLSGICTSEVTWKTPIRSTEGIKAYRIYRDDVLLAELPANSNRYYDSLSDFGRYTYAVSTLYADGTEMKTSAPSLTLAPQQTARPEGFVARQKGIYSMLAEWNEPGTNLINKSWYTPSTAALTGFGIGIDAQTIELGIGFEWEELANYAGHSIREVSFYPMSEQIGWTVNIYKYEGDNPVRIYSQPITQELQYKKRNVVVLDEPVNVPTDCDMIVAIEVMVPYASMNVIGMDYGHNSAGFGDLLRLSTEPDFYSLYYATMQSGAPEYATFMIEAIMTPEGVDLSADELTGYRVSVDGQEVTTTTELSWKSEKVASGKHTLGVQALYANGKESDAATTEVEVNYNYKAIDEVEISHEGTEVNLSWQTPLDDDATEITYAHGMAQPESIIGPAENNYGFMAGVEYSHQLLTGYEGYDITALRFFPLSNAVFTFMLYTDQEQIAEIPVIDYEIGIWNTVKLQQPIHIEANTSFFLVLDCYDCEPEIPVLGLDNRLPLAFTSDLISLDNMSWSSITIESGLSGNWMMGMVIADPTAEPASIDGYDVTLDSRKVADKVKETSLTVDLEDKATGSHDLRINTYYTGRATSVRGALITFYIDPAGIRTPLAETYRLTRGTDVLCIEGNDVQNIAVIATDGKIVAKAQGNRVGITALPAGVYMVKADADGKHLSYKIVID